jgi:hypothetical protein
VIITIEKKLLGEATGGYSEICFNLNFTIAASNFKFKQEIKK